MACDNIFDTTHQKLYYAFKLHENAVKCTQLSKLLDHVTVLNIPIENGTLINPGSPPPGLGRDSHTNIRRLVHEFKFVSVVKH